MIKTYTYSIVALIHTEDREAFRFLSLTVGEDNATIDYDGGDYVVYHSLIDEPTYKLLYVMEANKEAPLSECYLTFKRLGNTYDSVIDHKIATVNHFKLVNPDK